MDERTRAQKKALWEQDERQIVSGIMKIMGMIARLEDELKEAEHALEVHRGKKID